MKPDLLAIVLAVCLIAVVAGIVVVALSSGSGAVAGTGLGALATGLAGALAWRVRSTNGKEGKQ